MPEIPHLRGDRTLALRRDPYGFVASTCESLGTDVFETRIMLRPTYCMRGREAASLMYDETHVRRSGAMPARIRKPFLGDGTVQGLDQKAHRHRKALLVGLLDDDAVHDIREAAAREWTRRMESWKGRTEVPLYAEAKAVLGRAVAQWAGVPLGPDADDRIGSIASLYEHAGDVGWPYWRTRRARRRLDEWLGGLVEGVRNGAAPVPRTSPLSIIARHRALDGHVLPTRVAAGELLNLLRPTIAVSVYVVHLADALERHPGYRDRLRDDPRLLRAFVEETRRLYPFFPAVLGRLVRDASWQGFGLRADHHVLLDLTATNRHPRTWNAPALFRPERFLEADEGPYGFVPQGGGSRLTGHRCAGEPLTVALMEQALEVLLGLEYAAPPGRPRSSGVPPLPEDGFVLRAPRARGRGVHVASGRGPR